MRQILKSSLWSILIAFFLVLGSMPLFQNVVWAEAEGIDQNRIKDIINMLPEKPAGFGTPITERNAWKKLAKNDSFKSAISEAERLLKEAIPEQPDDLYLDFSRTGNRTHWQRVASRRRGRIHTFVLAECIENKGRFIPAFEEIVRAIWSEHTWVMPAHDRSLTHLK